MEERNLGIVRGHAHALRGGGEDDQAGTTTKSQRAPSDSSLPGLMCERVRSPDKIAWIRRKGRGWDGQWLCGVADRPTGGTYS